MDSFPSLTGTNYEETSPESRAYNCIAWAAQENDRWWSDVNGYFWPETATRGNGIQSLIEAFESRGFTLCEDGSLQEDFEKVALYEDESGNWLHASRQLPGGAWTSKLGEWEDIQHAMPEHLEGDAYGRVAYYMKRLLRESLSI